MKLFSNRGDGSSFSLAEQFYAAHIPASQRAHIFLSHDHLALIQETVRILASFDILKKRVDLMGRSRLEAWKFEDNEKGNASGDPFIMEHSAKLKESEFTNASENGNRRGGRSPQNELRG